MSKKVALAYSGGLDTSVILKWLKEELGYSVIAMSVDVGQGEEELEGLEEKALATGAEKVYVLDRKQEFVKDYVFPTLQAGAIYEGKYLLGTAMARPLIGKTLVEVAEEEGAEAVAHGATGKGNDQVRFELAVKALNPDLKIIAPWRIWSISSRSDAIAYAKKYGIPVPVTKEKPYSMDRNLWHISYEGGMLEDPNYQPEEDMFLLTKSPQEAPEEGAEVEIEFEKGIPVAVNDEKLDAVSLLIYLNKLAGEHGIGRVDLVENRLVGIKSRGVYETPGGTLLSLAHRELEHLVLDRETFHYKEQIALKYAELVYYGLWFTPLKKALDAFVASTQERLSGQVRLKLYRGNVVIAGRSSPYSLYNPELATFEADSLYNQKDAEGFINLFGLPLKVQRLMEKGCGGIL
ncbi:MAG: argininosuccinate synthase [Firmicutes bacterium]|nr:argininosuccinate synthase [Bacillota bacterium]